MLSSQGRLTRTPQISTTLLVTSMATEEILGIQLLNTLVSN